MPGRRLPGVALLWALAVAVPPAMATEETGVPLHNPFRRPPQAIANPAAPGGADAAPAEPATPRLVLKSLLLAGPDTVVSINDALLRIGERVEGWRLVEVKGTRAVLAKDGKRLTLEMKDKD